MMKIKFNILLGIVVSTLMFTSCVNDLDVKPIDPNKVLAGNLLDKPENIEQTLGKLYASFILEGQGSGKADIASGDDGFFVLLRAVWNLQEITTDEGICAWGDAGIADLNTQTWSPQNPFLTAAYQRLSLSVTYCNDFLNNTAGSKDDPKVKKYRAEARFLRALAYYWQMDLFGNPPFTTEADGVGKYYPKQTNRKQLFQFVVNELKAIEDDLGEPGSSYPQADKGACWMLLARTYLNAEVYIGEAKWDSVKIYTDKVLEREEYGLDTNYRRNFSADNGYNDGNGNKEMIFAFSQDGTFTQGNGGTTFLIQSSSDANYINAKYYHNLGANANWNGNRARKQLMNILVDTLTTYSGSSVPDTDTIFAMAADKRVYLRQKKSLDIPTVASSGDYGVGVYKFTALKSDGTQAENYSAQYASTDFPIFRLADAYLMRAEALMNLGNNADAVKDINKIRARAYGNASGNITAAGVTNDFLSDERAREFYYEGQRRTNLIRYNKFTGGSYLWSWKGGTFDGSATEEFRNLFPIPGDEISSNKNIKQNAGY